MVDDVAVEAVWARLRRAHVLIERRTRIRSSGRGTDFDRAMLESAVNRELCDIYGADDAYSIDSLYVADRNFLRTTLQSSARILGQDALQQMRGIRNSIWNLYLHPAGTEADPGPEATLGHGLFGLARSLACWLVYLTDSPFPALSEDMESWRNSTFGVPDLPAISPMPGGPPDLDAGVPTSAGPEGGLALPSRWGGWTARSDDYRPQQYARYMFSFASAREIQLQLLARERGGHPILVLVGRFRTPAQIYELLRLPLRERNAALRALVREIEQFLLRGETEFETALAENDWETLEPLLHSATWLLFPDGPAGATPNVPELAAPADAPLHRMCAAIIEHDLVGWTLRDFVFGIAFVASIGLAIATLGASGPVALAALEASALAIDVTAAVLDVAVVFAESESRALANRYATIDRSLEIAQQPESVTVAAAVNIMSLLLPMVVSRVSRGLRIRLTRRALADVADDAVPRVAGEARAATRSERALGTAERGTAERGTGAAERGTGSADTPAETPAATPAAPEATPEPPASAASGVTDDVGEAIDRGTLSDSDVVWEALPASAATHAGARLAREQEDIMLNLLGRNWHDMTPWAPAAALSAERRLALTRADATARDLLARIRAHWDAALARGAGTLENEARLAFEQIPVDLPESEVNRWVRAHLFDAHRGRAMRRIWNDTALREALAEAGITIHWLPRGTGASARSVGSFRIRGRSITGEIEHIFLDVDHSVVGHAAAVAEARATGRWEPLVSTVSSNNMQLLTGRENRIVIEELRDQIRNMWGRSSVGSPGVGDVEALVDVTVD